MAAAASVRSESPVLKRSSSSPRNPAPMVVACNEAVVESIPQRAIALAKASVSARTLSRAKSARTPDLMEAIPMTCIRIRELTAL